LRLEVLRFVNQQGDNTAFAALFSQMGCQSFQPRCPVIQRPLQV
jgi:hypothetical protein